MPYKDKQSPEAKLKKRIYRQTHKERIYKLTNEWKRNHPERTKEINQLERARLKLEVLTYYGTNRCACVKCGESRLACLSLDHINGNGKTERKLHPYRQGSNLYRQLKREGYPKGFQTLCMNCQFVKRVEMQEYNLEKHLALKP